MSYLISLAGAEFAVYHDRVGDLPLDYYVAKHVDEATARRFMGHTPKMIRFFGEKTGQPYPYNKYAQVCVPDFVAGGMENITATTMTDSVLVDEIGGSRGRRRRPGRARAGAPVVRRLLDLQGLVAHLAQRRFRHLLCRDFSPRTTKVMTYSASRCTERPADTSGGDRYSRRALVEERYRSSEDMFDGVTYSEGCVRAARAARAGGRRGLVEGDPANTSLRTSCKSSRPTTSEKRWRPPPGKDLKWFFDQWVYKAGHPELKVRWHYEDADKTLRLHVQQTQALDEQTPLFRLPTTLEITEDAGGTSRRSDRDRRPIARIRRSPARPAPRWSRSIPAAGCSRRSTSRSPTKRTCSSSSTPRACWAGLSAAAALIKKARTNTEGRRGPVRGLETGEGAHHPARAVRHSLQWRQRSFARRLSKEPRTMSPACELRHRRPGQAQRGPKVGSPSPRGVERSQASRTAHARPPCAGWCDGK